MTSVRTSYSSGATSNPVIHLIRANPVTGAYATLIEQFVVNDSNSRTFVNGTVPANLGLVNNALHTHTYQVCVGSISDYFYGARIAYTYTKAGD